MRAITVIFLLSSLICFEYGHASDFWGPTGHRATGEIAEKYLKRSAKKKIDKLLKG